MKKRNIDLAVILIWPLFAVLFSFLFKANVLVSLVLFLVVPSVFLSIKGRVYVKKAALFSLIGVLVMIIIDYLAHLNKSWLIPNSVLPFRLFNLAALEGLLWVFFTFFFVVMFYEYFINKHKSKKIASQKLKYLGGAVLILFALFFFFLFYIPSLLKIPYFYLFFGIVFLLIPFILQFLKYPKTTSKFFIMVVYFFYLNFFYEITALKLGWWTFPGTEFIGWISVLGVTFPIEEMIFWFVLLVLAILSFYEFFDDDEK